MKNSISKHLTPAQIRGLDKFGDGMLPGYDDLASFSASGCVRSVDRVLDYMSATDLKDLKMLLWLLAFFPRFLVAALLHLLEFSVKLPDPIGNLLRFMRIGLRGLVMTLYYSDTKTQRTIGYEVSVYTADLRASPDAATRATHSQKAAL